MGSRHLSDYSLTKGHVSTITLFNMKMIIALAALMAVAVAAPVDSDVHIVNETPLDNIGVGGYNFGYQLSNGATREETGQLTEAGSQVVGSYSWVNPFDNVQYTVRYTADKDGFRAEAGHLPV